MKPAAAADLIDGEDANTKLPSPFGFSGTAEMTVGHKSETLMSTALLQSFNGATTRVQVVENIKLKFDYSSNGISEPPYDILALREIAGMEPFMGADKNGFPWPTSDYDAAKGIGPGAVAPDGVSAHYIKLTKDLSSLSANEQREQLLNRIAGKPAASFKLTKDDAKYGYFKDFIEARLGADALIITGTGVPNPDVTTLVGADETSQIAGTFKATDATSTVQQYKFEFDGASSWDLLTIKWDKVA